MPKQKIHSGAKKRFRVTRNGKVMHKREGASHLLEHKSPKRKRRLSRPAQLEGEDAKQIRTLLGR